MPTLGVTQFRDNMMDEKWAKFEKRMRTAEMLDVGRSQAQIAKQLGVTRTTVMRWARIWRQEGRQGLAHSESAGRPRKISPQALTQVLRELDPRTSLDEVVLAIEKATGVHYHPGHLWRVLQEWGWRVDPKKGGEFQLRDPDGNLLEFHE